MGWEEAKKNAKALEGVEIDGPKYSLGARNPEERNTKIDDKEHWCIKRKCNHGTLAGSIALGFIYLEEFKKGYAQGYKDAEQDAAERNQISSRDVENVK